MSSIVCVRCVARCLQEPRDFREALEEHGHHVNFNAEFTFFRPCANCPLGIGISNMQLEVGVSSLEVRAWQSSLSTTLPQMSWLLVRGHASEGLSQHLALRSRKSGPHARTPREDVPYRFGRSREGRSKLA